MKEVRIVRVRYRFQFLLGHVSVSVQTTERYLGCKQRIRSAVNDRMASSRILELSWVMSCGRVADNPFTI
jgi:hypothetical protein